MKSNEEILELEKSLLKLENLHASFDYLRISIASPQRIRNWSERILPSGEIVGEVLRPETINFRTHQPESSGLFCEKIFGPIKNWKCKCGKYNGFLVDKICEDCHVEVIEARVRRYRMGYIDLTCPVTHLWYLKGVPNYLCILLRCFDKKISVSKIEEVVYFKEGEKIINPKHPLFQFFYTDTNDINELKKILIINNLTSPFTNLAATKEKLLKNARFPKRRGAEIIKAALESLNIKTEIKKARTLIDTSCIKNLNKTYLPNTNTIRRIRILESFLEIGRAHV